ncbi:MAG: hypothetical protein JWM91_4222 [Rhodospirillales bacterium]|nr:hypothetical protein [Rhodospirillales bacterium]
MHLMPCVDAEVVLSTGYKASMEWPVYVDGRMLALSPHHSIFAVASNAVDRLMILP